MPDARRRPRFAFIPQVGPRQSLERRELMTASPAIMSLAPEPARVDFGQPTYVVSQSQPSAEVTLTRTIDSGPVVVKFWTDTVSGAGINYRPVETVVTFADGERSKSVEVPLIAGASNPGQIEVGLHLQPETPGWSTTYTRADLSARPVGRRRAAGAPAVLQIVARPEVEPPQIVSTDLDRSGLRIRFSEPMDPARASDRRNYVLMEESTEKDGWMGYVSSPLGDHSRTELRRVPIREAVYDPSTYTVTLQPGRPLSNSARYALSSARLSTARLRAGAAPARALTDTAGNALVGPSPTRPGQVPLPGSFRFRVPRGPMSLPPM